MKLVSLVFALIGRLIAGPDGPLQDQASPSGRWPALALSDVTGAVHAPREWADKRAIVLLFVTTDCPLSNGYVPEFNRLARAYTNQGIAFYAVQADSTIPIEDVRNHVREFAYEFAYLLDPQQLLAAFTGATTIPEAAVLSAEGRLEYLGRIDNRLEDYGRARVLVTEHDLRDALDAMLAGKPVPHPRTNAVGCAITR